MPLLAATLSRLCARAVAVETPEELMATMLVLGGMGITLIPLPHLIQTRRSPTLGLLQQTREQMRTREQTRITYLEVEGRTLLEVLVASEVSVVLED